MPEYGEAPLAATVRANLMHPFQDKISDFVGPQEQSCHHTPAILATNFSCTLSHTDSTTSDGWPTEVHMPKYMMPFRIIPRTEYQKANGRDYTLSTCPNLIDNIVANCLSITFGINFDILLNRLESTLTKEVSISQRFLKFCVRNSGKTVATRYRQTLV